MSLWRQVTRGLRGLLNGAAADRDVTDEVHHYFDQATDDWIARGLSADEARRAARRASSGESPRAIQASVAWSK